MNTYYRIRLIVFLTGSKIILYRLVFIVVILCSIVNLYALTPETLYSQAVELYDNKEYKKAIESLGIIIDEYPDNNWADASCYLMGDCYLKLGKYSIARLYFQSIIDTYSNSPLVSDAYFFVGKTYQLEDENEKSIDILSKFISEFSDSYWTNEAEDIIESILKDRTSKLYTVYFNIADKLMEKNLNNKALYYFQLIIQSDIKNNAYYKSIYNSGVIFFEESKFHSAIEMLSKISIDSDLYSESMIIKAESEYNLKKYVEALDSYNKVINAKKKINNNIFQKALYQSADINLILGKNEEVKKQLNILLKKFPDTEYRNKANIILHNLKQDVKKINIITKKEEDKDEYKEQRKQVINKLKKIAENRESKNLDNIKELNKRLKEKINETKVVNKKKYAKIIEVNNFEKVYSEASELKDNKNYYESIKKYEEALSFKPDQKDIYITLALLYNQLENPQRSIELLEKYMKFEGDRKLVYNLYGYFLFKMNEIERSIDYYKKNYVSEKDNINREEIKLAIERLKMAF